MKFEFALGKAQIVRPDNSRSRDYLVLYRFSYAHDPWFPATNQEACLTSLCGRMLSSKPDPKPDFVERLSVVFKKMYSLFRLKLRPWSLSEILEHTFRKKTKQNHIVGESMISRGLRPKRSIIHFVKFERIYKADKIPRGVVYNYDKAFNFAVARYTKPFEAAFFRVVGRGSFGLKDFPLVAKGLDSLARGNLLASVVLYLLNCPVGAWHTISDGDDCLLFFRTAIGVMVISLDITGFDVHTRVPLLLVMSHFVALWFDDNADWLRLMSSVLYSSGWSANHTVRVSLDGNLCSGDMFTSICAVVLMLGMIYDSVRCLGTGDSWLDGCKSHFLGFGYILKLEKVVVCRSVSDLPLIEFTQSHPIRSYYGWRMCPDPSKHLAACGHVAGWGRTRTSRGERLRATALSELAMTQGFPVHQAHATWLLEQSVGFSRGSLDPLDEFKFARERRNHLPMFPVEVTPESRCDFSMAYPDWPIHQQLLAESVFGRTSLSLDVVSSGVVAGTTMPDHRHVIFSS